MSRQLTVIIVDDETLAREGLMLRLSADIRFDVVAQCSSAFYALDAIEQFQPETLDLIINSIKIIVNVIIS